MLAINPSSQMQNIGIVEDYVEGTAMRDLGIHFNSHLSAQEIPSQLFWSGYGDTLAGLVEEIKETNAAKAKHMVSLHSDSVIYDDLSTRSKTMVAYYYSEAGHQLANALCQPICSHYGFEYQAIKNTSFYVLKYTNMPACLIETLNHSDLADCTMLDAIGFRNELAQLFAMAYASYEGRAI